MPSPPAPMEKGKKKADSRVLVLEASKMNGCEEEKKGTCCGMSVKIIDPMRSTALGHWDMALACLLVATAFVSPYETAFLQPGINLPFFFNRIVDIAFLIDIVLHFFVAYPSPTDPTFMIKSPSAIRHQYVAGWFWIDIISVLPIDMVCIFIQKNELEMGSFSGVRNLRVVKLLRLLRLLRITRIARMIDRLPTQMGLSYSFLSMLKNMAVVILCCHWIACLWGGLAWSVRNEKEDLTWLSVFVSDKDPQQRAMYDHPENVYLLSLYWAIISLTSIGYGDICPQSRLEFIVACICCSLMACIWAYVIGAVCSIVSGVSESELHFRRTMDDLNWLITDRQMPIQLGDKFRRYFNETREPSRQCADREIFSQMSPKLQGEFTNFMHGHWIRKVWFLKNMPDQVVVVISKSLEMAVYAPNEEVSKYRTLFIIQRGLVACEPFVIMRAGDIWGADMLLTNDFLRRQNLARTLSYVSVLMLHAEELGNIFADFPEARAVLRWAQVQIAIVRGVQKIAEVTNLLEKQGGVNIAGMSEPERMDMFSDIMQGKYDQPQQIDVFGTGHSFKRGYSIKLDVNCKAENVKTSSENTEIEEISLGGRVYRLEQALESITEKMEKVVMATCGGPSGSQREMRDAASVSANFGPLRAKPFRFRGFLRGGEVRRIAE